MIFRDIGLPGAVLIDLERHEDERGWFARSWCADEFAAHGLPTRFSQCNVSFNRKRGTLRGLHYQVHPFAEAKLVRCTRGKIFDVIVDLRPASRTHLQWRAVELSADNGRMVFVPEGFAHGFQSLSDDSEVCYQMSRPYAPEAARGVRFDDPAIGIVWPIRRGLVMSERDRAFPLLGGARASRRRTVRAPVAAGL
ncbi:MAG: dTDP-4-dehydrorhamnose 3,5-epimerase [Alphaproteobacteria bacterium]